MRVLIKKIGIFFLCIVCILSFSGCTLIETGINYIKGVSATQKPQTAKSETPSVKENAITIGVVELDTYNPLTTKSPTMKNMLGFMFEPLFVVGDDMNPVGVLATGYQVSPDGKSVRITLKENVLWHNGQVFTARDVVYTINSIRNSDSEYNRLIKDIVSVSQIDEYTINVIFNHSTPNPASLLSFPIIRNNSMTDNFNPIGTGPFCLDYNKLSAFASYHGEKPKLEYISIKSVPDNEKFLSLFNASVIDIADSEMIDMSEYMPRSNAKVHNYHSNEMVFVGFNAESDIFKYKEARRAVSAIINRQEIASHIYFSRATATNYPINPDSSFYPESKGNLGKDFGIAEKILKDAGWKKDKRNVYFYSDNISMTYFSVEILAKSSDKERLKIASEISDAMSELGIKSRITSCSDDEFTQRINAGNYQMFIGKTSILPNNDLTDLLSSGNLMRYSDTETDILISQIGTLTNVEDEKGVYQKLADRLKEESPIAPICFLKDSLITSSKLKSGVHPSMSGAVTKTEEWSVK